ncbi:hypothetical protein [Hymenobacter psychrophilus]|uniref:Uncharacterized protein n=1 Tax=Hymenobacter psychrophilus TaxID=651662 RepID=A0A1H3NTM8_9BACT|nr:hypothetical protein [Hymenobacter psychrophilus]SDY92103.1 hypothetical protein SAMN04488069_1192 [Hymenobacter psychrophilus]
MTFDDDSAERFEADFPSFDASFAVTYEDALRLVRGYLRSYEPTALPELLERCTDLKLAIATEQLHQVYYGPLVKQEPKLIQSLLGIFGYQARLLGFDVGPIRGKTRYMLFLKTKGRLGRFQQELAAFDAEV